MYFFNHIMSLLSKIGKFFAPEPEPELPESTGSGPVAINTSSVTMQQIYDALEENFRESVAQLSTKYNLLYNTSFTIYLKADNFTSIQQALPFLADGAEQMLVEKSRAEIEKRHLSKYQPHSRYWQFQLVEIPEDALIGDVNMDDIGSEALIQISSELFPPTDEDKAGGSGDGRVVQTIHGVSSLKAIKNCINPEILTKLDLIEQNRIRLILDLYPERKATPGQQPNQQVNPGPAPRPNAYQGQQQSRQAGQARQTAPAYLATLVAEDGCFLEGMTDRQLHTMAITSDEVHVCGRSAGTAAPGVQVFRVSSDRVMTPHIKIRRDPSTGRFQITALGPTKLAQIPLTEGPEAWRSLPANSVIMLNGEVQLRFNVKK